jgi:putative ABC transport system permease protein
MWWTHLRLAARALRQHAFRSSLTVLSVAVGCFGVVAMTSLAESGLTSLARSIEELGGARLVFFVSKAPEREKERARSYETGLDADDFERVFGELPLESRSLQAMLGEREALADSGKASLTDLVAAEPGFFELFHMKLAEGRAFDESDMKRKQPVCVVGHTLAEKLWQGSPIGRWLTIEKLSCRVIGLFANNDRFGVRFGFDWTNLVVVPHSTLLAVLPEVRAETSILAKTRTPSDNETIKRTANARLEARHHGVDDFTIYDFGQTMQRFERTFRILELMVALVSGIALLIGGVGIMNMMLVSVAERVREIGVRKALGARKSDISGQFATEAALFGVFGGGLGVGLGIAVALVSGRLIASALPSWVGVVSREAALGSFVSAVVIALIFGWLPARKAGRLDPVEAMRR